MFNYFKVSKNAISILLIVGIVMALQSLTFADTSAPPSSPLTVMDNSFYGIPNPYTSVITSSVSTIPGDGKTTARFTVYLYDAQNNVIKTPTPIYMVSSHSTDVFTKNTGTGNIVPSANESPAYLLSDENGMIVVDLTATDMGNHQICFGLKNDLSTTSTFGKIGTKYLTVSETTTTNLPLVTPNPYTSVITSSVTTIPNDGKTTARFTVYLYDAQNNVIKTPTPIYMVSSHSTDVFTKNTGTGNIVSTANGAPAYLLSDENGMIVVDLTATDMGNHQICFGLKNDLSTTSTFGKIGTKYLTVSDSTPLDPNAANQYTSTLSWDTNKVTANGKTGVIVTIQLYNGSSENVKKPTAVYLVTSKGTEKILKVVGTGDIVTANNGTPLYVITDETGKAVIEICSTEVGISRITVGLKPDLASNWNSAGRISYFELTADPAFADENLPTDVPKIKTQENPKNKKILPVLPYSAHYNMHTFQAM